MTTSKPTTYTYRVSLSLPDLIITFDECNEPPKQHQIISNALRMISNYSPEVHTITLIDNEESYIEVDD